MRAARGRRRRNVAIRLSPAGEKFLDTLERLDALLAASAGGFTSRYRREVLWPHALTALAASALGRPVVFSGLTVRPFTGVADRIIAALALRRALTVIPRDTGTSVSNLRRLGVPSRIVETSVDPAVALEPASPAEVLAQLGIDGAYGVISAHGDVGLGRTALTRSGRASPQTRNRNRVHSDGCRLRNRRSCGWEKLTHVQMLEELPPDDVVLGVVAGARFAIGTRYHLAVFAAAQGVPPLRFTTTRTRSKKLRD